MTTEVKSGCSCPLCGKEMRLMAGGFYYEYGLGVVDVRCHDCNVVISEYGYAHGLGSGEAQSYHKLVNALCGRMNNGTPRLQG